MRCDFINYSEHAIAKMAERDVSVDEVETVIERGEIIKRYPDDQPSPGELILGFVNQRPLHVVISRDYVTDFCLVVTVYSPDITLWSADFKTKK